jgi:hypothetical protein
MVKVSAFKNSDQRRNQRARGTPELCRSAALNMAWERFHPRGSSLTVPRHPEWGPDQRNILFLSRLDTHCNKPDV